MNIGVAIVTYNSAKHIEACIKSVKAAGLSNIAVVDSASRDRTVDILSDIGVSYMPLQKNKGFGYAANRAAELLNTEYVLFLNPDSALLPEAIQHLSETVDQYPASGIIGMLLCDGSGKSEDMAYGDEPTLIKIILRHLEHKKIQNSPFSVDWVSGGALLISKKIFQEVNGFDEEFFLYWEDIDLCRRVREKGYPVLIDPTARVAHVRGGSDLGDEEKMRIYDQSADRYFKKHYPTYIWKMQGFLRGLYRL